MTHQQQNKKKTAKKARQEPSIIIGGKFFSEFALVNFEFILLKIPIKDPRQSPL